MSSQSYYWCNSKPPPKESPRDRERREAREKVLRQSRYGGGFHEVLLTAARDIADGTYDSHVQQIEETVAKTLESP